MNLDEYIENLRHPDLKDEIIEKNRELVYHCWKEGVSLADCRGFLGFNFKNKVRRCKGKVIN